MRKLIYAINLTIDGCLDHTKVVGSEDILEYFTNMTRAAGLFAYGRTTYELMVPYWPDVVKDPSGQTKAGVDFAKAFVATKKIVFSQSLDRVEDENSTLSRAKPEDELLKLKQEQGKDILLGGVALSSRLIALGLVDEYYFVIHPIIAGEGRRLMEGVNLQERLQLKLADTEVLRSGCVALHYVK
jgi:dihydrofolate reductase